MCFRPIRHRAASDTSGIVEGCIRRPLLAGLWCEPRAGNFRVKSGFMERNLIARDEAKSCLAVSGQYLVVRNFGDVCLLVGVNRDI